MSLSQYVIVCYSAHVIVRRRRYVDGRLVIGSNVQRCVVRASSND